MEEAIKITDLGEIIQGQRLELPVNRISKGTNTSPLVRVWCELRPSEMEAAVLVWDSDKGTASVAPALEGNGYVAQFDARTPNETAKIRPGVYYGDIQFRFADGYQNTKDRLKLTVKGGYTKP